MNKFVVCAMDKRKTKEELLANYKAAYCAADADADAYAAAAYDGYDADAAAYPAYPVAAYWSSAAAYWSSAASLKYYLNEYFELTGENREAYQKEADK